MFFFIAEVNVSPTVSNSVVDVPVVAKRRRWWALKSL